MFRIPLFLSGVAAIAVSGAPAYGQMSGSIWTTTSSGSVVNGNLYNTKGHVYLSGGPGVNAPCTSPGLPDGPYYFQVTNPSGSILLSTDPITNREVVVIGGVVRSHSGTHTTRSGPCGSTIVQLLPFADTPQAGGEYKVWLTPVANYDPNLGGFFGFLARFSKTDNFKIKGSGPPVPQSVITGFKFYDFNENGLWDAGVPEELPIPGWKVEIYKAGVLDGVTFTDETGRYTFLRDLDNATYVVVEVAPPPGFIPAPGATWLAMTPTQGAVVANASTVAGPEFGNLSFVLAPGVGRSKGFWHNQGQSLLAACDPEWRDALGTGTNCTSTVCLRRNLSTPDPCQSIFLVPPPPATFSAAFDAFADWIVGDPALGHAGFMLSTQVAATILSNTCGFMQGTIYIDRHLNGVLVSLSSMLQGATALLCHPNAGETGPNDPYQDLRNQILGCLGEFTTINNSGELNNPQPVYKPAASSPEFGSPY